MLALLAQSKFFIFAIIGLLGVWQGSKLYRDIRLKYLRNKIENLQDKVVECYDMKAKEKNSDDLRKCLLRAKEKPRRVKRCHKRYGG